MLGIADALLLLQGNELDDAIASIKPTILVLGNEFKDDTGIQTTLAKQRKQGGSVQFHAGEIHYATADLLIGSERDLREQRRSLFRRACQRQGVDKDKLLEAIEAWGGDTLDCIRRHDLGSICSLRSNRNER